MLVNVLENSLKHNNNDLKQELQPLSAPVKSYILCMSVKTHAKHEQKASKMIHKINNVFTIIQEMDTKHM